MSWRFFDGFLLRATGFPIERLTAVAAGEGAWEERIAVERKRLFAALADDAAREAILTSAPLVDANFDGWRAHAEAGRRNAQDKKRERVLWRFLQRLTAKNDSTSFFGAIALGTFELKGSANASVRLPIEVRRTAYATQWVVARLLEQALAALGHALGRRAPGVTRDGVRWKASARGFVHDDGPTLVDGLPSGLIDPVGAAVQRLEAVPASPERDAWIGRVAEVGAWRDAFAASAGDVARRREVLAHIDARAKALLGEPAQRGEGEFYASRSPVHEQAERADGVIGLPAWARDLEAAARPFLEFALLLQAPERVVMRTWFERTFESSRADPVLWTDVLEAIAEAPLQLELAAPASVRKARDAIKRLRVAMRAQVDQAVGRDVAGAADTAGEVEHVVIDPAPLMPEIVAALAALGPLGTAYANPDFMVAVTDGGVRFVLAEAHHLPCLTPCLLPSVDVAATEATRAFLVELTAPALPAFPVSYDHSFISVGPELGAVGLELSGLAKEPTERRATFADLAVYAAEDGLRFVVENHATQSIDVVPLTRTARVHQAAPVFPLSCPDLADFLCGPDWRAREGLPRLSFGDLIVHRRRYLLTPDELPKLERGKVREYLAAKSGGAAPRFMFARMASEPKPILIDWGSALSTELALWSLQRGEALELSEMLPAPEACWLESDAGHHTSELRTVLVRR